MGESTDSKDKEVETVNSEESSENQQENKVQTVENIDAIEVSFYTCSYTYHFYPSCNTNLNALFISQGEK